uniref:Uncharacterized protein n=1 Tax=Pyramimonas obovata TaxID=1411642 RepID=A0A7S0MT83_9CHLO|mmetsp:Transcript_11826/g.24831  ORF Transcript_11826/g.24831 Transcript_11826/m.24831 type:complete len:257 (+) Transcript_11826:1070-1840(+)
MDHFSKASSPGLREWVRGLDPRYRPPCRETCIKILRIIQALVIKNIADMCGVVRAELGEPCLGGTMDLWSLKSAKETFACFRVTLILRQVIEERVTLTQLSPVVAFSPFKENHHTGAAIARWGTAVMTAMGLTLACILVLTGDGASNNTKAAKIMDVPFAVCGPHNLQRSVLVSLGEDGGKKKPSSNPQVKKLVQRNARMTAVFKRSNVAVKRLADAQVARGVPPGKVKVVRKPHNIRWGGIFLMVNRLRELESDV